MAAPIEKTYAERMFKVGDHLRHDGLRDCETFNSSRNAAGLHYSEQNMKVPQFDAATDAIGPIHESPVPIHS